MLMEHVSVLQVPPYVKCSAHPLCLITVVMSLFWLKVMVIMTVFLLSYSHLDDWRSSLFVLLHYRMRNKAGKPAQPCLHLKYKHNYLVATPTLRWPSVVNWFATPVQLESCPSIHPSIRLSIPPSVHPFAAAVSQGDSGRWMAGIHPGHVSMDTRWLLHTHTDCRRTSTSAFTWTFVLSGGETPHMHREKVHTQKCPESVTGARLVLLWPSGVAGTSANQRCWKFKANIFLSVFCYFLYEKPAPCCCQVNLFSNTGLMNKPA